MSKKKQKAAATPALAALNRAGVDYTLLEYEHPLHEDDGWALGSADALDVDPATVFKTLMVEVDGKPAIGIVPATATLNLKRMAKAAGGKKAVMMDVAEAERLTGYVHGGISPLGQKIKAPVVIDASAETLATMLVSGGKRSLSMRIAPGDLASVTRAQFADIAEFHTHF
ncbi:Cys-tRNA(Pro) deacylase [Neoactinobaculum massilliense]|uniref:Cys-tRNA(Pro) deacylase n=1 Tax=Neoactinobaculum massilliense TaxID=2364794 RepID=UPI000F53751A|nr:Cys-tRNA(Pro) deacylase [Neoactinobaculum massilliense]